MPLDSQDKILVVSKNVPTKEKKSTKTDQKTEYYTLEELGLGSSGVSDPDVAYVSSLGDNNTATIGDSSKPFSTIEYVVESTIAEKIVILEGTLTSTVNINIPNTKTSLEINLSKDCVWAMNHSLELPEVDNFNLKLMGEGIVDNTIFNTWLVNISNISSPTSGGSITIELDNSNFSGGGIYVADRFRNSTINIYTNNCYFGANQGGAIWASDWQNSENITWNLSGKNNEYGQRFLNSYRSTGNVYNLIDFNIKSSDTTQLAATFSVTGRRDYASVLLMQDVSDCTVNIIDSELKQKFTDLITDNYSWQNGVINWLQCGQDAVNINIKNSLLYSKLTATLKDTYKNNQNVVIKAENSTFMSDSSRALQLYNNKTAYQTYGRVSEFKNCLIQSKGEEGSLYLRSQAIFNNCEIFYKPFEAISYNNIEADDAFELPEMLDLGSNQYKVRMFDTKLYYQGVSAMSRTVSGTTGTFNLNVKTSLGQGNFTFTFDTDIETTLENGLVAHSAALEAIGAYIKVDGDVLSIFVPTEYYTLQNPVTFGANAGSDFTFDFYANVFTNENGYSTFGKLVDSLSPYDYAFSKCVTNLLEGLSQSSVNSSDPDLVDIDYDKLLFLELKGSANL